MLVESELPIEKKIQNGKYMQRQQFCEFHPNDIKRCNHLDNPTKNCTFSLCPIKIIS